MVDPKIPANPYVQPSGEYKGYFVAKTSLSDGTRGSTDTARYVDSNAVPYVVLPTLWYPVKGSGSMGDFAAARTVVGGRYTEAILADTGGGSAAKLGEASIELFRRLGDPQPSPRNGLSARIGPVMYMVFPRTRQERPWPVSSAKLKAEVALQLVKFGGWPDPACFRR